MIGYSWGTNVRVSQSAAGWAGQTHVKLFEAVDGVLGVQQLVGEVHDLLVHRLFVPLHLP